MTAPGAAHITEPMTLLTDYALAALSAVFAVRISRPAATVVKTSVWLWSLAFGVTALAALAGGTAHGFRLYLGETAHAHLWRLTVGLIGLGAALTLAAALHSVLRPGIGPGERRKTGHRWLQRGLYITLAGVAILLSRLGLHEHFNHNDLYHVVQMGGLHCFYRGARLLSGLDDREP